MYAVSSCLGGVLLIGLREMKRQRRVRHRQKRLFRAIREVVIKQRLGDVVQSTERFERSWV
jgi:hypothetical protein